MKLTKNLVLRIAYKLGTELKERHFRESAGFFARIFIFTDLPFINVLYILLWIAFMSVMELLPKFFVI